MLKINYSKPSFNEQKKNLRKLPLLHIALTMRYLKVPGLMLVNLFLDKSSSIKFCCPLKLSSLNDEISFVDKSAMARKKNNISCSRVEFNVVR